MAWSLVNDDASQTEPCTNQLPAIVEQGATQQRTRYYGRGINRLLEHYPDDTAYCRTNWGTCQKQEFVEKNIGRLLHKSIIDCDKGIITE